ncbi:hypothetical protein ACWENA_08350 [Streptomyces sp. NPDC004779]
MNRNEGAGRGLNGLVTAEQAVADPEGVQAATGAQAGAQGLEAARRLAVTFQTRIDNARHWARRNLPTDQRDELLRVLRGDTTSH